MFRLILPVALASCAASALGAQTFAEADSLLAVGDTSGAIAVYEAMVADDLRNAEAHYRAGVLYMTRHTPGTDLSAPRRAAEEHFRYATRFEGDSAKYWLALAELFRGEDWGFTRVQVAGLVDNAREAARRTGETGIISTVEYRAARVDWERYEQTGRRYLIHGFARGLNATQFMVDWRYVENFVDQQLRPDPAAGEDDLLATELHLREALHADPGFVPAVGLQIVALAEHRRWEEALPVTRRAVRAAPSSGPARALLALVYARLHRWEDAEAQFDTALALMSAEERAPYDNLGLILRQGDQQAWDQAPPVERDELRRLYWNVATPLLLTDLNETRTEFQARLTYALHRWSDPLRGYAGFRSDIGSVYVRYGPPDLWALLGRGTVRGEMDRNPVVWVYFRSRLRFVFGITPGFARTYFAGNSKEAYREAREQRPTLFTNIPLLATMDTVEVQTAQFRSDSAGLTDVGVFSFLPVGRMVQDTDAGDLTLTAGAIIQRNDGREVVRERREETVRGAGREPTELRTWRLRLPAHDYLLRVEAHLAQVNRGARSVEPLTVRRFGRTALQLSDVLLARRLAPRDSASTRWTDFLIEPTAGRLAPDQQLSLLWETYNLAPDSTGVLRYTVTLRINVTEIERRGFFAQVVGGIADAVGVTAEGDDAVELTYDRDTDGEEGGATVEYLTVDLADAPEGRYTITVIVTDRVGGGTAAGSRTFLISNTPLEPQQ